MSIRRRRDPTTIMPAPASSKPVPMVRKPLPAPVEGVVVIACTPESGVLVAPTLPWGDADAVGVGVGDVDAGSHPRTRMKPDASVARPRWSPFHGDHTSSWKYPQVSKV